MDGDLSLSQSFGGLRIANPDDTTTATTTNTTTTDTAEDRATSPFPSSSWKSNSDHADLASNSVREGQHQDLSTDPTFAQSLPPDTVRSTPLSTNQLNRLSMVPDHHDRAYHPPLQTSSMPQNLDNPLSNSIRPSSNYFPSASNPISRASSYRHPHESSAAPPEFPSRNDSRGGSAALQAGVPIHDSTHHDRSYARGHGNFGNGPLPPRRSSRAVPNSGGMPQHTGSSYASENALSHGSEDWKDRGAAVGIRQEIDPSGKPVSRFVKKGVRDFSFGRTLGEGSYSTVVAASDRHTSKEYAIKILDKRHIIKEKKVKYVNIEKDTLNRLTDHPGVVRLYYTFQDERSLYFVLDLASGGELLGVLKRMGTFDVECARYYGAQILDTIDYMHRRGVIHRDLKPENVLLDNQGHVKITDFGTAKMLSMSKPADNNPGGFPSMDSSDMPDADRASSFVGTAEYVSPELLTNKNACKASDLWAFGCIIYQLLAGRPPFKAGNEYQTFQKIVGLDYQFPHGFPPMARDLVERLLVHDPDRRLQIEHIKNHEFFDGIVWGRGLWKQKPPRLKPYVPPPAEPIKLNGSSNGDNYPPSINIKPGTASSGNVSRPYPRVITELPPPSQVDLEWSPVLKRTNERILKLGNLIVSSSAQSKNGNGDGDAPKKFSRFFGGSTPKKRQRLVLVTSAGRVIVVQAGGEEKKPKLEISLLHPDTQYRSATDAKGLTSFVIDTVC